jgi:hypothetical protein
LLQSWWRCALQALVHKYQHDVNHTITRRGSTFARDVAPTAPCGRESTARVRLLLHFNSGVSEWRHPQQHADSAWTNMTYRWGGGRYPAGALLLVSPSKWEVYARPHAYAANLRRLVDGAVDADGFPGPAVFVGTETYASTLPEYFLWQQTQRAVMRAERRFAAVVDTSAFTMDVRDTAWDTVHFAGFQVLLKLNLLLNAVCRDDLLTVTASADAPGSETVSSARSDVPGDRDVDDDDDEGDDDAPTVAADGDHDSWKAAVVTSVTAPTELGARHGV